MKLVEHENERIEYIEATAGDIELATKLLAHLLVRPDDELPPVTMNVLVAIKTFVTEKATASNIPSSEVRFTRRELRERTGIGHTQTKLHLRRLEEMEYLRRHREKRTFLFSVAYDADRSGLNAIGRGSVGPRSGAHPAHADAEDAEGKDTSEVIGRADREHVKGDPDGSSYRT